MNITVTKVIGLDLSLQSTGVGCIFDRQRAGAA